MENQTRMYVVRVLPQLCMSVGIQWAKNIYYFNGVLNILFNHFKYYFIYIYDIFFDD